LLKSTATDLTH